MFGRKAQGTAEYLIILAAIVVIALIVVWVVGRIPGLDAGINESQSKAYWQLALPFSITTHQINSDGSAPIIVLRNQTGETYTVTFFSLGGTDLGVGLTEYVGGTSKQLTLAGTLDCGNTGDPYSYAIVIGYQKAVGEAAVDLNQIGTKHLVGTCV